MSPDISEVVVAKESFGCEVNGVPRAVTKGETFHPQHTVVQGREDAFEPFKLQNDLEQATAAPGERRTRGPKTQG